MHPAVLLAVAAPLALGMAGCAHAPGVPSAVHYRCEDGRHFAVWPGADADSPVIELRGMRFQLHATAGDAERHGCSQLTLWRRGADARVDLEGDALAHCRAVR